MDGGRGEGSEFCDAVSASEDKIVGQNCRRINISPYQNSAPAGHTEMVAY